MTRRARIMQKIRDARGVAAIEFAVALPVFLTATMAVLDLSYEQYASAVLHGVVDKAARDGSLEGFAADQSDLDEYIKRQILDVWPGADVSVTREAFAGFNHLRERNKPEKFTDINGDGKYDKGECFQDTNGNGQYDKNRGNGKTGNGGAEDVVLLTATVTRQRIFPGWQFINMPQEAEIVATMTLRNQPYASGGGGPQMICGDGDDDD